MPTLASTGTRLLPMFDANPHLPIYPLNRAVRRVRSALTMAVSRQAGPGATYHFHHSAEALRALDVLATVLARDAEFDGTTVKLVLQWCGPLSDKDPRR